MIKDLTKMTKEDIERSAKEAVETPIIALQDDAEVYSDALCALHMGKEVVDKDGEYRKSCVNKSFRDKIKNIKEGFFLWVKK